MWSRVAGGAVSTNYQLDLDGAWARVLSEAWSDQVPDVLRWDDSKLAWAASKARIEEQLTEGTYVPNPPMLVEVPKDGFVTRLIAVFDPGDRAVFEAIVDRLTPFIESALPPEARGFRIKSGKKGKSRMQSQPVAWAKFQADCRRFYDTSGLDYLITTDITAYFQYVEFEILGDDLKSLAGVAARNVDLLTSILNAIRRSTHIWG